MKLLDSAFSPFARKVRMVLEHKGLAFETIDGLLKSNHTALVATNSRAEVPALIDGEITVVNSADIVAYLEHRYPQKPVYPADPATRARARAWERTADTLIDPIITDISYWRWAERPDSMPEGLLEAARADLSRVYEGLDRDLAGRDFVCGALSIADIALFPHLAAVRSMDAGFSPETHKNIASWLERTRAQPIVEADRKRTRAYVVKLKTLDLERRRIFWRGDRIEWLLAHGFHDWFMREIAEGRVLWPGPTLPP